MSWVKSLYLIQKSWHINTEFPSKSSIMFQIYNTLPSLSTAVWNGTVPWLPPGSFQPPQPQRQPAHHPQTAAVRWPCRSARGCALHSLPTAGRKTVCSEREHRVGPSPILPRGVWIIQLCDGSRLPVTRVPLSELVWERAVLASAVGLGALPEDMSQQVWREGEEPQKGVNHAGMIRYWGMWWAKWSRHLGIKDERERLKWTQLCRLRKAVSSLLKLTFFIVLGFNSVGYDNIVLTKVSK